MSSFTLINKYLESLKDYSNRHGIISAATPLELSKRDGIKDEIFALKVGTSAVDGYYEDNRVEREVQNMDITCFVETTDTHTDRDYKYTLMLNMADEIRGWVKTLDNSTISTDVFYTKYIGVINTVDDRPGFYAQVIRLEFNANQQTQ